MLRRATVIATIAISGLGACTSTTEKESRVAYSESLWNSRTAYVGDNAKVSALAGIAGFASPGTYTLSLNTATPPYSMKLSLTSLEKPFEATDFSKAAVLMLGTVANLDRVEVAYEAKTYSLTAGEATKQLGYDVKTLGRDQQTLADYVRAMSD